MANHASHAALPYPIKGARYTILIPYLDADGDPTDPTTPDTEISEDDGAATDTAEEVASPKNSVGMLTLTGAETDCSCLSLAAKAASGPKTTLATLYPRVLASVGTGTLSAGSAGGGTLGTILAYDITGCFIKTTGGTGGGGAGGLNNQARRIVTYNTGTGAFTVTPNWETTPDATTTYDILLPEDVTLSMLRAVNPTTAGRTLTIESDGMAHVDLKEWLGVAPLALTSQLVQVSVGALQAAVITAASIAAAALNGKGDWNIGKTGYALSAAGIQAIWDALTAALTTANSIGKLLVDNVNATISSRLASADITLTGGAVTVGTNNDKTGYAIGAGGITSASFGAGAIDAAAIAANAIGASELAQDAAREIADELLDRDIAGGASGGARNVRSALRRLRNRVAIAAGTATVYQEDDTTSAWTAAVTTAAGNPVSEVDPS